MEIGIFALIQKTFTSPNNSMILIITCLTRLAALALRARRPWEEILQ